MSPEWYWYFKNIDIIQHRQLCCLMWCWWIKEIETLKDNEVRDG